MAADSLINAVNDGVNGGDSGGGGGGVSSPVRPRNMPSVWAQVVRGGTESDSADPVAVEVKNVNVTVAVESRVEGSDNGDVSGNGNDESVTGVKKAAWNTSLANGGVEGSGSGNTVMGGGLWPALSESIGIGGKVLPPSSSELSLDGSNAVLQEPIVSQPPPPKQVKPNANHHSNTNHGKRPAKKNGSVSSGGTSTPYNRPPPPPSLPPPPPPPFPLVGMYGNLVPAVLESSQPPFKGSNWSPRPVDPSLNRNPARRNNYGPRLMNNGYVNNGYGGRRDHHGSRSPTPRDVHMQHQIGPPPPPPIRPFMRPSFMPPPLRPYGAPMGFEMGPSYVYVPTLPEPYRSGAPGAPSTMFMPRMNPPFHDPILKQIEYYFSNDNLVKDNFLRSHMDEEGWVSLALIAGFRRVQQLTNDIQEIVSSLKNSSTIELQDDKMRRRNDWRKWIQTGSQSQTYIEEASLKNLTLEDKPSNDKEEVGPSSSLKLPNGEVTSEEPSS